MTFNSANSLNRCHFVFPLTPALERGELRLDWVPPFDPTGYVAITLRMTRPGSFTSDIQLSRPAEWVSEHHARVGRFVYLNLPEMSCEGEAEVLDIAPAPPVEPGPGRAITGIFRHSAALVYDLKFASEANPIGVTALHPFWSVDRQTWVSAIDLKTGETLKTLDGTTTVESRTEREQPETVYNIEVEGDHVYRVGESGVLVHNASSTCGYKIVYTNATNPDCSSEFPESPYGAMLDYDIIRIEVPGLRYDEQQDALARLEGKKLTESVTSDGGCATAGESSKVSIGSGCTISANGIVSNCRDLYGICKSDKKRYPNGTCTETFTQKLFIDGEHAETWKIVFKVSNSSSLFSATVVREKID